MHAQSPTPSPTPGTTPARRPNALSGQTSPYLLQHQFNPVDWRPWGPEAFAEARERDVPIFLSIGYSTCYWCHVMERESFEDQATADVLNALFVCVKVDREERPDVDDLYMTAVQLFNHGQGGWPMSLWLTPPGAGGTADQGLKPIYAATYLPRESMHARPSLAMVSRGLAEAWRDQREEVIAQAERAGAAVSEQLSAPAPPRRIDETTISAAIGALLRAFDEAHGGFGGAPKFPQTVYLDFLIDTLDSIDSPAFRAHAERAIRRTLDAMALGGVCDQAGGGFHRYAVDAAWRIPHFEKMLYDQAQIASLYAKWYSLRSDAFDAGVLRDALAYVEREMTGGHAMFLSAQDAEVDAREGLNYLWTRHEFARVLGDDADFAARVYGLTEGPNFQDPHHPDEPARNVLFLAARPGMLADGFGLAPAEMFDKIASIDARLLQARAARKQPALDDKVIASWNGLMIAAFADAARALGERKYLSIAQRASDAAWVHLRDERGGLRRSYRDGTTSGDAVLEDYAMLARAELALHRAARSLGADPAVHLARAGQLLREASDRFADGRGGFYDTERGRSDLFVRTRSTYDGAIPSPSGVMLHNLIDLHEASGRQEHLDAAVALLVALSGRIAESPVGLVNATRALYRLMAIDASIPDRIADTNDGHDDDGAVRVLARVSRVLIPERGPATLELRVELADGYHLNAHDPGVEGVTAFRVDVEGGTGVQATPAYPAGVAHTGAGAEGFVGLVYDASFDLVVTLTRDGPWSGRPMLIVTFQACSDTACLPAQRVELDIALDPGE